MKSILCFVFLASVLLLSAISTSTTATTTTQNSNDINSAGGLSPATPKTAAAATPLPNPMTNSPMQPIMRAIDIIEFVSQFSNSESDGFGVVKMRSTMEEKEMSDEGPSGRSMDSLAKTSDPLTALSKVLVYGAVKVATIILSVIMYTMSMLMPNLFATVSVNYRNAAHTGPLDYVDYTVVSESIASLPTRSFELFDIRDVDCQNRAMCEIGEYVSTFFGPQVAKTIQFMERLLQNGSTQKSLYMDAMVRGLGYSDCKVSFKTCPRSPFKKFQQLINAFSKIY